MKLTEKQLNAIAEAAKQYGQSVGRAICDKNGHFEVEQLYMANMAGLQMIVELTAAAAAPLFHGNALGACASVLMSVAQSVDSEELIKAGSLYMKMQKGNRDNQRPRGDA